MYTYQDLLAVGNDEKSRIDFVEQVISEHKKSELYKTAVIAEEYNRKRNVTINNFKKVLTKVTGEKIIDEWSANFKVSCGHFNFFVTQQNQYLLGNGVTWTNETTANKLGTKKRPFDTQLQKIGKESIVDGIAFGFYDSGFVDVFSILEFAPLFDEEDSELKAGVKYWQIDPKKPKRAILFEIDGFTSYIWKDGTTRVLRKKTPYRRVVSTSKVGGTKIIGSSNYDNFPIVPLWGSQEHQSALIGLRERIDCFDLIESGFANTVDEASYIYWTLTNAGGMQDDISLEDFVRKLKTLHAVPLPDEVQVQPNMVQAPFEAREALLKRLEDGLYRDAMALNLDDIKSGSTVTSQITAAYDRLDKKCDEWEFCLHDFIGGILDIAGIDDTATFTRAKMVNVGEEIQNIVVASSFLTPEYVTTKILTLLGDGDKAPEIIAQMNAESLATLSNVYKGKSIPEEGKNAQSGAEGE